MLDAEAERDAVSSAGTTSDVADALVGTPFAGMANATQAALEMFGGEGAWPARATSVAGAFVLAQESMYRYPRRPDAPDRLRGEQLPPVSADFEAGLAAHVDFSPEVLADRLRGKVQVQRLDTDLFAGHRVTEDGSDLWANLSPEAVAEKAEQIRLRLVEANDRELYRRLLERFVRAIEASGAEVPEDEELQMRQLDLLLVRRPRLLREAFKSLRQGQVLDVDVLLPAELFSDQPLRSANRGLYGVFPAGLNQDELAIAERLDASAQVRWWHRNQPKSGIGLYRWDEGDGFYPDFVVSVAERSAPGIALLELKGEHLWASPVKWTRVRQSIPITVLFSRSAVSAASVISSIYASWVDAYNARVPLIWIGCDLHDLPRLFLHPQAPGCAPRHCDVVSGRRSERWRGGGHAARQSVVGLSVAASGERSV